MSIDYYIHYKHTKLRVSVTPFVLIFSCSDSRVVEKIAYLYRGTYTLAIFDNQTDRSCFDTGKAPVC
jgi:hypothetical protein